MVESAVVDTTSGLSKKSKVRTSTGTFLPRGYDEVVSRIEKRVAAVTMIPIGKQDTQGMMLSEAQAQLGVLY